MLRLRPLMGALVYVALLCWYSSWQPIDIAGIHLTAPRLVMPVLLWRCTQDRLLMRRFKWIGADTAVMALTAGEVIAGLFNPGSTLDGLLQNRGGAFFDTAMVYFVVRLAVVSEEEYARFLKGLLIIAAPIAMLGVYQSLTGSNPWGVFVNQGAAFEGQQAINEWTEKSRRHGFYRAYVNFPYPITFGFHFALVGAAAAGALLHTSARKRLAFLGWLGVCCLGMLSSMSSGPVLAGGTAMGVIVAWPFRRYWKVFLGCVVASLAAVDIISNRHWYDVLGWYFAFNSSTAEYRIELVKEALGGGMRDHWVIGYGLVTPSNFRELLPHWQHTDIANHYVYEVMRFGLLGFVPWVTCAVLAIRNLVIANRSAVTIRQQWIVWCLGASLAGVLSSMMSACWEGQGYNVFFAILGLAATAPFMVRESMASVEVRRMHELQAQLRADLARRRQLGGGRAGTIR